MRMISKLGQLIIYIEESLLALMLGLMIILATTQIVMRNLWGAGIDWSDPLLRVLVLWLGLLGAMAATRDGNHIKIDLLSKLLPASAARFLTPLTNFVSATICAIVCYHAARFVIMERADGAIAFATVPAWLCEVIIPIGFGLMALRFLANTFTELFAAQQQGAE